MAQNQHRLGLALVAAAALCWSSSGLFTRAISAELFTMLFWRGLVSGTLVFAAFFVLEGKAALPLLLKLRWPSLFVALFSTLSMVTGIGSLRYGSVADAMVIYATVPFVTAGIAYFVLGERSSNATLLASAAALVGVIIMIAGSGFTGSMLGKGLAVFMMLGMACCSVLLRQNKNVPMLPAMAGSAYLCSFFSFWFAKDLQLSSQDIPLILAFGILQNGAGLLLYTLATRKIPAAEATLLAALEVPFTPLWVWLLMGEVPAFYTMIGGAIVLLALFAHILNELRGKSPAQPEGFEVGL